jgi:ABC-type multidrug transport system ATPase subunit
MGLRIRSLKVGWFRGFREADSITFDDSISVFYGPNGSGKSCVIEAIEWALFGDIGRAVYAAHRQAYIGHRPVHNPHQPDDSQTFVEIHLDQDGLARKVRRELVDFKTTRLLVDGDEVDSIGSALGVSEAEMLRPVISRHEGRVFLDSAPTARWERIASLLGVDVYGTTSEIVRNEVETLRRDAVLQESSAIAREIADAGMDQLAEKILATPYSAADTEAAILAMAAKEGVAAESVSDVEAKLGLVAPAAKPPLPSLPSIAAQTAISEVQVRLGEIPEPAPSGDESRQAFLRAGMGLSDPESEVCPYCGEKTIDNQKRQAIVVEVESLAAAATQEQERENAKSRLRTDLAKLPTVASNNDLGEACRRAGASPETIGDLEGQFVNLLTTTETVITTSQAVLDCTDSNSWRTTMEAAEKAVEQFVSTLRELEASEDRLRASVPSAPERDLEADRRREAIRRACREKEHVDRAGAVRVVLGQLEQVTGALKKQEREAVRARLGRISQRVVEIYESLNPEEKIKPTVLDVPDGERNEVRIKGETYGAEINPATTFSDGHLLCLSLALAIPYRADLNPTWNILLIDDPLFGIDPDHSARVADLIHELAVTGGKQIVVTSYYRRFVRDLENLGNTTTWEAKPYSEEGIILEAQGDEIEMLVREATTLRNGASNERRESGRKLREAFELVTERAAKQLDKAKAQMRSKATIAERLERLEELGIEPDLLGRLKGVGDRVGEASHAEDTDPSPTTLQWCCEQIEDLRTEVLAITSQPAPATANV